MSDEIVLDLTKADGTVEQKRVPITLPSLYLTLQQFTAVSDNIAQLTRMTVLRLNGNAFAEIPSVALAMTQLTWLNLNNNRLSVIPREIGRLTALTQLVLGNNKIAALPREVGQLHLLAWLDLDDNPLTSLPAELGQLRVLQGLYLQRASLEWLPMELDRLPLTTEIYLDGNPLPIDVGDGNAFPGSDSRDLLPEIFAATTALSMIREHATTMAIGLQDLELPALVTLEILDAAWTNSIPMHKKWDLLVAVKHFHDRAK